MRHHLEVLFFAFSAGCAVLVGFSGNIVLLIVAQFVSALLYWITVRPYILRCPRGVAKSYRTNAAILVVAGVLCLLELFPFIIGLLLLGLAFIIGARARRYGHPKPECNDVPRHLQFF